MQPAKYDGFRFLYSFKSGSLIMKPQQMKQAVLAYKLAGLVPLWDYEILKDKKIKFLKKLLKVAKYQKSVL